MHRLHPKSGWIEAITGSMFSGKSEELIRRLRRAEIARQRVQIFKPFVDRRYDEDHIVTHSQMKLRSIAVKNADELLAAVDDRSDVVGIDEAQFFDDRIVDVCRRLANRGKRVIVAGLDLDYRGEPFGPIPGILAIAEYVDKQLAICMVCGAPANHTQRLTGSHEQIEIGAQGMYEARCRYCFEPPDEDGLDRESSRSSATSEASPSSGSATPAKSSETSAPSAPPEGGSGDSRALAGASGALSDSPSSLPAPTRVEKTSAPSHGRARSGGSDRS